LNGELYLKSAGGWNDPPGQLWTLSKLSNGETLTAIRQDKNLAGCVHVADGSSAALTFAFSMSNPGKYLGARYDVGVASLLWQAGWIEDGPGSAPFQWNEGWGLAFGSGKVGVIHSPQDLSFTQLAKEDATVFDVNGTGSWLIWGGFQSGGEGDRIRSYHTIGGVKTIASTGSTAGSTLRHPFTDGKRVAWNAMHHAQSSSEVDSRDLVWADLPADNLGTAGPEHVIPLNNVVVDETQLRVLGDYGVIRDCAQDSASGNQYCYARVVVVHLPTGKIWRIKHRPAKDYNYVLAITQEEILIGERSFPSIIGDESAIETYLRFRLDSLDSLQAAW
jgi:hypothetical protein